MKEKSENYYQARYHFDTYPAREGFQFQNVIIHQVGDLYCGNNTLIPQHDQYCTEFTYVTSGVGTATINDKKYPLKKGILQVTFPGDLHEIESDVIEPLRYFYIGFTLTASHPLYEALLQFIEANKTGIRSLTIEEDIERIFLELLSEISNSSDYYNILIESYINELIVTVLRAFSEKDSCKKQYSFQFSEQQFIVSSAIHYIEQNAENVKYISQVYEEIGYSASYVSNLFRKYMDMTPVEYLQDVKMKTAVKLLRKNLTVTDVAERLGYSSIHPFCRAFTSKFGESPTQYIARHPNETESKDETEPSSE